jgi:hypothetical protein
MTTDTLNPFNVEFAHKYLNKLAVPVPQKYVPALRALVKKQYPKLPPHELNAIVEEARDYMGPVFGEGRTTPNLDAKEFNAFGEYIYGFGRTVPPFGTLQQYSDGVNLLSTNPQVTKEIEYFKDAATKKQVQGSMGYGSEVNPAFTQPGQVQGKQTLSAYYVQPGTEALDTPIAKKVDSVVNSDFFSYFAANPEHGEYNAMYLQDQQWKKEVRFAGKDVLPRRGNDQQYQLSFKIAPQNAAQQPVEYEMMDKVERDIYAAMTRHNNNLSPLKDKHLYFEPIMGGNYEGYMFPAVARDADGVWPYPSPEQPHSSAYVNAVGFKPQADTWVDPYERSRFLGLPPTLSAQQQVAMTDEAGYFVPFLGT